MAELYRKDGEWRMNAVGAGYEGGLQALGRTISIDTVYRQQETGNRSQIF